MKAKDVVYLNETLEKESFDYAFTCYSDFKEIEDEKFHELRKEFLKARMALAEYIGTDL